MFGIIRLIIGCIFLGCSITIIKKSKVIRKHILYVVFTGLSVVLITILAFLPFENLYMTFNSPKRAYEYVNWGKSNIVLTVEGNNSDFVVDRKSDSDIYLIIPKTSGGWKIGIGSNTKRIVQKISDVITIYMYQYKNTNDYFITVLNTDGGALEISDSYNSEFYSLEKTSDTLKKTFVTYYAHISEFDSQYYVMVNGNKIILQ